MRPLLFAVMLSACGPVSVDPNCTTVPMHPDVDGDGFGDFGSPTDDVCLGSPGYASNDLDCGPDDPRAFPGQTEWQNVPISGRVSGDRWDFDCNGQVILRWLSTNTCYASVPGPSGSCYQGTSSLPTPDGYWRVTPLPPYGPPACGEERPWVYRCYDPNNDCLSLSEPRVQACL